MSDERPIVYLMRGLPSYGKSHRARRLADPSGVVLETDTYFFTEVGHDPKVFDYSKPLLPVARDWNYKRFQIASRSRISPIVVDRGNGLNAETHRYAVWAVDHGYHVALAEPDSAWWSEIRVLLKYKEYTAPVLEKWANELAARNRETHRTPAKVILRWMMAWQPNLTVEMILKLNASGADNSQDVAQR